MTTASIVCRVCRFDASRFRYRRTRSRDDANGDGSPPVAAYGHDDILRARSRSRLTGSGSRKRRRRRRLLHVAVHRAEYCGKKVNSIILDVITSCPYGPVRIRPVDGYRMVAGRSVFFHETRALSRPRVQDGYRVIPAPGRAVRDLLYMYGILIIIIIIIVTSVETARKTSRNR